MKKILLPVFFSAALGTARAQTWESVKIPASAHLAFSIDAKDGMIISGDGNSYWSPDQGKTWTSIKNYTVSYNGQNYSDVKTGSYVAFQLNTSETTIDPDGDLFSIGYVTTPGYTFYTLFRSTDHGLTWNNTIDSLPIGLRNKPTTHKIFCEPNGVLYMVLRNPGTPASDFLYVSWDKGKTWEKRGNMYYYLSCAADPDSRLYCNANKTSSLSGSALYRSGDSGSTWDSVYEFTSNLAVNQKNTIAGGSGHNLVASFSDGETFTKATYTWLLDVFGLIGTPDEGVIIATGAAKGILKLNKALDSWVPLNAGLGLDSAVAPTKFQYDSKGNLYVGYISTLYVLRNANIGIRHARVPAAATSRTREYNAVGQELGRLESAPSTVLYSLPEAASRLH